MPQDFDGLDIQPFDGDDGVLGEHGVRYVESNVDDYTPATGRITGTVVPRHRGGVNAQFRKRAPVVCVDPHVHGQGVVMVDLGQPGGVAALAAAAGGRLPQTKAATAPAAAQPRQPPQPAPQPSLPTPPPMEALAAMPPASFTSPGGLLGALRPQATHQSQPPTVGGRAAAAAPEPLPLPLIEVVFELQRPGFGQIRHTARYNAVVRNLAALVVGYHVSQVGERYLPVAVDGDMAAQVVGQPTVYGVVATGITFTHADWEYCVLLITNEANIAE